MTLYCEAVTLGKRFFGGIPLRMTSHRKGGMLGIRFFTSLRSVQNDNVPLLLSRRKEVTKKGRPPVIGYSRPLLRSPSGAAELAPLKQSSPSFLFLPRSVRPDKCGHTCFSMQLALICETMVHHQSAVFLCRSTVIPSEGASPTRNLYVIPNPPQTV